MARQRNAPGTVTDRAIKQPPREQPADADGAKLPGVVQLTRNVAGHLRNETMRIETAQQLGIDAADYEPFTPAAGNGNA